MCTKIFVGSGSAFFFSTTFFVLLIIVGCGDDDIVESVEFVGSSRILLIY